MEKERDEGLPETQRSPTGEFEPVSEERTSKPMNGNLRKLIYGLFTAAIIALIASTIDSRTRLAVIEGNRYTDEDARNDRVELESRFLERFRALENRFCDFSPKALEKKVDNIESLVREIRSWQIKHTEMHAQRK